MNGMPASCICRAWSSHGAAVGRDDADAFRSAARASVGRQLMRLAHRPGWKAVIWLLSSSVMMMACAVYCAHVRPPARCRAQPAASGPVVAAVLWQPPSPGGRPGCSVGDVAGATTELAPSVGTQERHVRDVHLLGRICCEKRPPGSGDGGGKAEPQDQRGGFLLEGSFGDGCRAAPVRGDRSSR